MGSPRRIRFSGVRQVLERTELSPPQIQEIAHQALSRERAIWLATHILPHETGLRRWLLWQRKLFLDADDVIQESYTLISALACVDHITNPRAYLFQTAKSILLTEVRRSKVVSIEAIDNFENFGVSDAPSPEQHTSDRQELRLLSEALEALPLQVRDAFKMRKIDGMPQKQIAKRLGLTEKAVEMRVARALRLLVEQFGRGGNSPSRASRVGIGRFGMTRGAKEDQL